jgi:Ankyrin repeats (3 copies)
MNENGKPFRFAKNNGIDLSVRALDPDHVIETAMGGDVAEFERLVAKHPTAITVADEKYGAVALHVACSKDNVGLIELLCRKGASTNAQDFFGNTPLHYACSRNRMNAVTALIRNGVTVNLPDHRGNTPLHAACQVGNIDIVQLLLRRGADPEAMDHANMKPTQKTTDPDIHAVIEEAVERKKRGDADGSMASINWMGFGIGVGVGLGLALARQTQEYREKERREEQLRREREAAEKAAKEAEANAILGAKKSASQKMRKLL